jgi:hypothetical protein
MIGAFLAYKVPNQMVPDSAVCALVLRHWCDQDDVFRDVIGDLFCALGLPPVTQ